MYLVKFKGNGEFDSLHVVPKSAIDEYSASERHRIAHRITQHVKFASGLQTRVKNGEFREDRS